MSDSAEEAVMVPTEESAAAARLAQIADVTRLAFSLVGCALVGVGAGLHSLPLGFALPGFMLFTVAVIGGLRSSR